MAKCNDQPVITHDTQWQPLQCVDGGIFRAQKTYTNLEASGFNTSIGYSGHFYGIRKYTGLIPSSPFILTVQGRTGDGSRLEVPREIYEIEYGSNNNVDYSGIKLTANYEYPSGRNKNDRYGKSVSVCNDIMAIGAPFHTVYDASGYQLNNAGAVFVYERLPAPSGYDWSTQYDKAPWSFVTKLTLPSGYLRDYVERETDREIIHPYSAKEKVWKVGQEGRQFGHSIDICSTNNLTVSLFEDKKNIIVVGGPSCAWSRTFAPLNATNVNVALFVFTDEFIPEIEEGIYPNIIKYNYSTVQNAIKDKDILFKYFCDPPVAFNVKIVICEGIVSSSNRTTYDFPEPQPSFVIKRVIDRHSSDRPGSPQFIDIDNKIFTSLKEALGIVFPYDNTKLNNNIPSIIGFYLDDSRSFGGQQAVQPALNNFISYYKDYSLASGLQDFFNSPSQGFTKIFTGEDENWVRQSIAILNEVLDIDVMKQNDTFKLFASGIGDFNPNLEEFNDPPPSGGCVYIFERESGSWNLIQTIESPTTLNNVYPDRFGHAVKISDNGEVIGIGSPYINQALMLYEYDSLEKNRLYQNIEPWIYHRKDLDTSFGYYYQMYERYLDLKELYGQAEASKILYLELDQTSKYFARTDYSYWGSNPISEYKRKFTYSYSNIPVGNWGFFIQDFAPLSRLGYSIGLSEDGNIFAAGAPTDSLNEFDQSESYYAPARPQYSTWHSYVNTGAVRVFESRKYFPHNTVIEYGKFGNLEYETRLPEHTPFFNHMSGIYTSRGLNFTKTEFTDIDIPQEAGLVFIITPQVDALSDEILNNIKNWLALGDRNLVLVGNDPIWEKNGLYFESNQIINKILSSLSSRLRILPARNRFESLSDLCPSSVNLLPSFRPTSSLSTYIKPQDMRAYGVGDIKPYRIGASRSYSCESDNNDPLSLSSIFGQDLTYSSANTKCEIPIKHLGDLRSEWKEWCVDQRGNPKTYPINWPLFFGTVSAKSYGCGGEDSVRSQTYGYDGVPLLVAAEYPEQYSITYPKIPAASSLLPVGVQAVFRENSFSAKFAETPLSGVAFVWSSDSGNYTSLNRNINNTLSTSTFFDPIAYNEKDAILQAKASNKITTSTISKIISDKAYFCAEQSYNQNSKIILIAGTFSETQEYLYSGVGDKNVNFYFNLVAKSVNGGSYIAQLGDWTGRSSFDDATEGSILNELFQNTFNTIKLNVSTEELLELGHPDGFEYDVCWIANPTGLPNATQIQQIKSWLAKGNKKLIITYSIIQINMMSEFSTDITTSFNTVSIVNNICELFDLTIQPLYLDNKNKYAVNNVDTNSLAGNILLNENSFVSQGFAAKDRITTIDVAEELRRPFVPIKINTGNSIAYTNNAIIDDEFIDTGTWQLKTGVCEVVFPVLPGSGYKLFFTVASEHFSENEPLQIKVSNIVTFPRLNPTNADNALRVQDINNDTDRIIQLNKFANYYHKYSLGGLRSDNTAGDLTTDSINIQVYDNVSGISVFIDGNNVRIEDKNYIPKTTRLIGISGCLLPIETVPIPQYDYFDIYDWVVTPEVPEKTVVITPPPRPISTDNSKYCPDNACIPTLGNQLIEDGPVVAAQELEVFSSFDNGVARSRITVLSDSSFVQGRCIADTEGRIYNSNINFLQSLYPFTQFPSNLGGRSFNIQTKIESPERGTPQRFFNATGNQGLNLRFDTGQIESSGRQMSNFIESFNYGSFKPALHPIDGEPPSYELRRFTAINSMQQLLLEISGVKAAFKSTLPSWGAYTKFAGTIEGKYYEDAGPFGGIPEIMKNTGYDYLDFDRFPSGYPGDLFGYSIDIYKNKILIGAPFAAYEKEAITNWNDVIANTPAYTAPSGTKIGFNGGAGSVYLYEKSVSGVTPFNRTIGWTCTRKFRPNTINIGQDTNNLELFASGYIFGNHNYKADDLNLSIVADQFGHSVKIESDLIAIGAPGHDFDNYVKTIFNSGAFIKKEFDLSLDTPKRIIYDLGESGVRNELITSGISIINNGAIFIYENRLTDWQNKKQQWKPIQKIVSQGYNSRKQKTYIGSSEIPVSGSENDRFGKTISLSRVRRNDSDYILVGGTDTHLFENSGEALLNAGAIYIYDGILRKMPASTVGSGGFLHTKVFGDTDSSGNPYIRLGFSNDIPNTIYSATGIVYSNNQGEIFLEASGQDVVEKSYIRHRPYIEAINGQYIFGTGENNSISMFIDGQPFVNSGNMNLFSNAANSAIVYNNLGLYQSAVLGIASGVPSGLFLYTDCPSGITISESGFALYASGTGFSPETLSLEIRGK